MMRKYIHARFTARSASPGAYCRKLRIRTWQEDLLEDGAPSLEAVDQPPDAQRRKVLRRAFTVTGVSTGEYRDRSSSAGRGRGHD